MKQKLNSNQLELFAYMQKLSETAVSKSWVQDFEFELWDGFIGRSQSYGRLKFDPQIKEKLRKLLDVNRGWLVVDENQEPMFIGINEFKRLRKEKISEGLNWMNESSNSLNSSEWFGAIVLHLINLGKIPFDEIYTTENLKRNALIGWSLKIILFIGFITVLYLIY